VTRHEATEDVRGLTETEVNDLLGDDERDIG
jgi:hypothetical protein